MPISWDSVLAGLGRRGSRRTGAGLSWATRATARGVARRRGSSRLRMGDSRVRGIEGITGLRREEEASGLPIEGPENAPPEAAAVDASEVPGAQGRPKGQGKGNREIQ